MSDYSVEEILQAKRVAKEAGYDISLPNDRIEQAKNIAKANGYNVRKLEDPTEMAMQVAKDAGFNVVPNTQYDNRNNPNNSNNPNNPNNTNRAPEKKQDNNYSWAERQAAKYL